MHTATATRTGPASCMARPCWACARSDVCFSAAKLFFAYGLGNALSFPLSVGATVVLMAERPTPEATFKRWSGARSARPEADGVLRRPHRLCRHAGPPRACRRARSGGAAPGLVGRRGPAGRPGRALQGALRRGHRRRHRLHRDAAHLPFQHAAAGALRHHRLAGAGLRDRAARRRRRPGADGGRRQHRAGRPLHQGPVGGHDVLGQPDQDPRHLPGRLDQERRQVRAQHRRQLHLQRAQRRHAQGQRHLCLALRGRGHAGAAPGRAGSRGDRRARCRGPDQDQGLRGAQARPADRRSGVEGVS